MSDKFFQLGLVLHSRTDKMKATQGISHESFPILVHCVGGYSLRMFRLDGRTIALQSAPDTFSNADSISQFTHTCRSASADHCDRYSISNRYTNHADSVNRNADADSFSRSHAHTHRDGHRYKHNHADADCDDHNSQRASVLGAGKHHDSFLQHKL